MRKTALLRNAARLARGLCLVLLGTVSACSGTGDATTLTLWHAWGGQELTALRQVIQRFEADNPGQRVMALQVPYDKLKDKFLRSAAANGGPDLLIGDADWSGKFAVAGLLRRIDTWFSPQELSRFNPRSLTSLRLRDKLYAVPESREAVALYYNKRLLPKPPATVSEWFNAAERVSVQTNGQVYGLVFNAAFYYAMGYYFGEGGKLFAPDGQVALNGNAGRATLQMLDQMSRAPGILTSPEYSKGDSLYKQGQTAMILNGPWALADYQRVLKADLGVARLPALAPGKPAAAWVGVKCMMVNANSDDAQAERAKAFALHMTSPDVQRLMAQEAGHIPAIDAVQLPMESPQHVFMAEAAVGTPVSIQSEVSLIWEPMDKAIRQVIAHQSSPEEALAEAETILNAKLAIVREQKP